MVEYSLVQAVPQLVERQAAVRPNSAAVAAQDRVLTYHDLNSRAGELANRLRSIGVGPDVMVGLCLKSSIAMVVGALGILKAGGAYLPLDPADPADAPLSFILNDAKAPVLVTSQCRAGSLPAGAWRVIGLDIEGRLADGPSLSSPVTEATPEKLGLCHLYLRIDRSTQRSRDRTQEPAEPGLLAPARLCRDAR